MAQALRIGYYILFGLFTLLIIATFVIGSFFEASPAKLKKLFNDPAYPLQYGTYTADGITLDYAAVGPDTAQRIIFIHGSPGNWENFADLMSRPELFRTHRLIAVNRIGYGISHSHPGVASLDRQVDLIEPLMVNSQGGIRPVLVGHSLGGPIVVRAAMRYSDRLKGVVSLAGSLDAGLEPFEWYRGVYKVFPINLFMNSMFKSSNDELFTHRQELAAIEKDWESIRCTTYIVQGLADKLVDRHNADFAEKKLARLPHKKIIRIKGEDHFIPWTKEEEMAAYILEVAQP